MHYASISASDVLIMARFTVTVDDDSAQALTLFASKLGISRSALVSQLVAEFCAEFLPFFGSLEDLSSGTVLRARGESLDEIDRRLEELRESIAALAQRDLPL